MNSFRFLTELHSRHFKLSACRPSWLPVANRVLAVDKSNFQSYPRNWSHPSRTLGSWSRLVCMLSMPPMHASSELAPCAGSQGPDSAQQPVPSAGAAPMDVTASNPAAVSKAGAGQPKPDDPPAMLAEGMHTDPPNTSSPSSDTSFGPISPETLNYTLQAVSIPPVEPGLGVRVEHFIIPPGGGGPAPLVVAKLLGMPPDCDPATAAVWVGFAEKLIWFGGVYFCPVPPAPPGDERGGGGGGGGGRGGRKRGASNFSATAAADNGGGRGKGRRGGACTHDDTRTGVGGQQSGAQGGSEGVHSGRKGAEKSHGGSGGVGGEGGAGGGGEGELDLPPHLTLEAVGKMREARAVGLARWGRGTDKQTPRRLVSPDTQGALAAAAAAAAAGSGAPAVVCPAPGPSSTVPAATTSTADETAAAAAAAVPIPTWGPSARAKQWKGAPPVCPDSGWQEVVEGGYLRVHVHPKRFPAVYRAGGAEGWAARVVARGDGWVVVDKPAGVQVPHTVDNSRESLVACVEEALGYPAGTLAPPHRLDTGTEGLVLLVQGAEAARAAAALMREGGERPPGTSSSHPKAVRLCGDGEVKSLQVSQQVSQQGLIKTYRCVMAAPPPVGRLTHWAHMNVAERGAPRYTRVVLPAVGGGRPHGGMVGGGGGSGGDASCEGGDGQKAPPGARWCELVVEKVDRVALTGDAAARWGPHGYEATITLITGRTHQIRAQMAACGCPLLGDHLYTVLATRWGVRPDARAHDCASASARDDDEASGSLGAAQSGRMGSAAAATQAVSAPAQLLAPAAPAAVVEGVPEPPCEAQGQLQGQEAPWWAGIKEEALNPVCLQAWRLEVVGGSDLFGPHPRVEFTAGTPWWRR